MAPVSTRQDAAMRAAICHLGAWQSGIDPSMGACPGGSHPILLARDTGRDTGAGTRGRFRCLALSVPHFADPGDNDSVSSRRDTGTRFPAPWSTAGAQSAAHVPMDYTSSWGVTHQYVPWPPVRPQRGDDLYLISGCNPSVRGRAVERLSPGKPDHTTPPPRRTPRRPDPSATDSPPARRTPRRPGQPPTTRRLTGPDNITKAHRGE